MGYPLVTLLANRCLVSVLFYFKPIWIDRIQIMVESRIVQWQNIIIFITSWYWNAVKYVSNQRSEHDRSMFIQSFDKLRHHEFRIISWLVVILVYTTCLVSIVWWYNNLYYVYCIRQPTFLNFIMQWII
jgi:hypothetical protein